MPFTRVKICGITRIEDALACAEAGVDAIGLVFVEASKRAVDIDQARAICRALPPFIQRVGLFMDAEPARVQAVLDGVALDCLQFHGNEAAAECRRFQRPWIKALAMKQGEVPHQAYAEADALLLDSHAPGQLGGSGETFDWASVPNLARPWILAGGLTPDNVALAIERLQPPAVDVSSGVETAPGIKNVNLINQFMKAIRNG
ncbi:MAG: phosphoribosylanthranilate isomerase [Wenzhouxiangella sp.]